MDTTLTEEQEDIRSTVRQVLAKHSDPAAVRAAVATAAGFDETLWRRLTDQLGLPGLTLPTVYGGAGCTATEQALVHEEAGRVLLPSPLLSSAALSAPLLERLGTPEQRDKYLPRLATGALTAALVVPQGAFPLALCLTGSPLRSSSTARGTGAPAGWAGGGRAGGIQARRTDDGWRLYGEARQSPGAHSAGLLLIAAHAGGFARSRTLLFLVEADGERGGPGDSTGAGGAPGLVRARQTALDETRSVGRVELRDTPAELLGADDGADITPALAYTGARAAALLAAEAVGAADGALRRTVEYTKLREQFGRPIGSFQAVQHRLADVYVQVEAARSAAYYAAWESTVRDSGRTDAPVGVSGGLALAQALEALRLSAGEAVQLHGGLGFTWEHEAQLYFKRAAGDDLLFGPVHRLREHAATRAGLFTEPQDRTGAGQGNRVDAGGAPARRAEEATA